MNRNAPLPDFENPPVIEVVLSVQFDPLSAFRLAQVGLLWSRYKDRFPITEEYAPIPWAQERFGLPTILKTEPKIEIVQSPPFPRIWFLNEQKTELIQVQQDRFARNWRKAKDTDVYPRYGYVRDNFAEELAAFRDFLVKEEIGQFTPNQCEVTYVNHIPSGEGWERHGQIHELLSTWVLRYTDAFLEEPEDTRSATRYIIRSDGGQPIGRLHIAAEPAYRTVDGKAIFILTLTARGRPLQENVDGVMQFLDVGHEWIVRGFASITTESMQRIWRRKQ